MDKQYLKTIVARKGPLKWIHVYDKKPLEQETGNPRLAAFGLYPPAADYFIPCIVSQIQQNSKKTAGAEPAGNQAQRSFPQGLLCWPQAWLITLPRQGPSAFSCKIGPNCRDARARDTGTNIAFMKIMNCIS
jgi:hypothetical protein